MKGLVDQGFTTFDLADVYGPAEDYVGVNLHPHLSNMCVCIPNSHAVSSSVSGSGRRLCTTDPNNHGGF